MASIEPQPKLTDRTILVVSDLMRREGLDATDSEAFSAYLERLVSRERLFATIDAVGERTNDIEPDELDRLIDETVAEVEDEYRQQARDAAPA